MRTSGSDQEELCCSWEPPILFAMREIRADLCFSFPFFSQLFVRGAETAILLFCISLSWGWCWSLSPVQCHEPPSIVHQALCLQIQSLKSISHFHCIIIRCLDQLNKQDFWKHDTVREWEMRHKSSEKSQDQRTNTAPRWTCRNWIQASFIILSAMNERRICRELKYNLFCLQGQRTKWSLTT